MTLAAGCVVLLGVVAWAQIKGLPPALLTRDAVTSTGSPWYTGILSNLGILLWASTAAVCLFTSSLMRHRSPARYNFFLWAGLFSLLLTFDDLIMIHEGLGPRRLGVPQWAYIPTYGALLAAYLVAFRSLIWRSDYLLLALACLFFGVSLFLDFIADVFLVPEMTLVEDSAKFFGILFWAGYFFISAASAVSHSSPHEGGGD